MGPRPRWPERDDLANSLREIDQDHVRRDAQARAVAGHLIARRPASARRRFRRELRSRLRVRESDDQLSRSGEDRRSAWRAAHLSAVYAERVRPGVVAPGCGTALVASLA